MAVAVAVVSKRLQMNDGDKTVAAVRVILSINDAVNNAVRVSEITITKVSILLPTAAEQITSNDDQLYNAYRQGGEPFKVSRFGYLPSNSVSPLL